MSKTKIQTLPKLTQSLKQLRKQGKSIAFTNGAFDILHAGHVTYLQKAKETADILIVGLNTDASIRAYKSKDRPINPQKDRAMVLAALEAVDFVILFGDLTPLRLIKKIMPDVLVKGADYALKDIVGAKEVLEDGGKVNRIRFLKGRSSTSVINKMKKSK